MRKHERTITAADSKTGNSESKSANREYKIINALERAVKMPLTRFAMPLALSRIRFL